MHAERLAPKQQPPHALFHFHNLGLCGNPRITDVGGVPYLVPLVQRHKVLSPVKRFLSCAPVKTVN